MVQEYVTHLVPSAELDHARSGAMILTGTTEDHMYAIIAVTTLGNPSTIPAR